MGRYGPGVTLWGSTALRRAHRCSGGDSSRLGAMVAGASGGVRAAGTQSGLRGRPSAGPNRGVRARALFPPPENSAGGRSVRGRRRYPRLSPIATTLPTASWEMENPRRRPSPPCGTPAPCVGAVLNSDSRPISPRFQRQGTFSTCIPP